MNTESILMDILRGRRSIRRFQDRPVARELLVRIVDAARYAPSAGNRQDWLFTLILSPAVKTQMARAVKQRWREIVERNRDSGAMDEVESYVTRFADFASVPALVVISCRAADALQCRMLGEKAAFVGGGYASGAMAAQNLMLAAHAMGVGSCCMTGPLAAEEELLALLGLGKRHRLVCLVALGYPAEAPTVPVRKPVEEIVRVME